MGNSIHKQKFALAMGDLPDDESAAIADFPSLSGNGASAAASPLGTNSSGGQAHATNAPTPPPADIDLTTSGNVGSIGDAIFSADQDHPTGTGGFDTFLQVQHNSTEQGYNTDHRPQQFNEGSSATHNHSVLLNNVAIVIGDGSGGTNDGTVYREFLLDANELNGGNRNLLSLDRLQIFQETSGNLTGFTPGVGFGAPGERLVYDLDAGGDHWVALNASLSSGSGGSDVRLLIPDVLFDQSLPYVVLYSTFGLQGGVWASDSGFEEWGTDTASSPGHGSPYSLNITKTATVPGGTADAAGEVISYAIRVHNTGSANLTGITVTDPSVSDLTRGLDIVGNNDAVLNVGEIWSYTASHTVTQQEIDATEFITNTATTDSDQTGPDSATSTVTVQHNAHAALTKNAAVVGGAVDAPGDVIHYRLTVTNDGNVTLTTPVVSDPQFTLSTPVDGDPVINPDAQIFTPVMDGDYNAGDTDNDGIEEITDHNGVRDPGETFQYVYIGDTDGNGRHDPGETWVAFNLGDADNDGFRDPGETFVGDSNSNGIEDNGELWQFKNLGDTNNNQLQDSGESWQYANMGDTNNNGVEDPGETFLYHNIGNTNQNGTEDPGEDFQYYNAGDTNHNGVEDDGETFQFVVTSTVAPVDNDNDGFNDGDTDLNGKVSVGETWKFTGVYTATQDDIDNRDSQGIPTVQPGLTHDNTATLTADQLEFGVNASTSVPITQTPQIAVTKAVSSITSTDEAVGTASIDAAGDVVNYTITVENTGNMTLTGLSVTDQLVADLAYVSGDTNNDDELDVDETWTYAGTYTAVQDDIDNRNSQDIPTVEAGLTLDNTVTATTDQGATDSASASVPITQTPQVAVTKTVASITSTDEAVGTTSIDAAGDIVNYAVTVENTGNVTLTGLSVTDQLVTNLAYVSGDTNNDNELDIDETWTYAGSYTAQQSDIDDRGNVDGTADDNIHNVASATTDQGAGGSASADVPIDYQPAVDLEKSASVPGGTANEAGELIEYTITVANAGNVTLTNPVVSDDFADNLHGLDLNEDNFNDGDTNHDGKIDVGETWTYVANHVVTQEELDNNGGGDGSIDNTASVTTNEGASDSDSTSVPVGFALELSKTSSALIDGDESGNPSVDDPIQYFFSLENNGSAALHDVELNDSLFGIIAFTPDSPDANGLLDPGETWLMSRTYLITADDVAAGFVDNDATADGLNPGNQVVTSNSAHWHLVF